MRNLRMNSRRSARLQRLPVSVVFAVISACGSNCLFAQDKQGSIDALLSSANSRLHSGESTQTVEAWLTSAMQQSGMRLRFAPAAWDSYAQAKWRADAISPSDLGQYTDTRNAAASFGSAHAPAVAPILVTGADPSAATRSLETYVHSSRPYAFRAPDLAGASAANLPLDDELPTALQLANDQVSLARTNELVNVNSLNHAAPRVSSSSKP
jgi:hypothetical protein